MQTIDPTQILNAILSVALAFSMLPGVSFLIVTLVNSAKIVGGWFGFSFDDQSKKVAAWLSLGAFAALVYFQVFHPDLSLIFLDDRARIIAETLVKFTGLLVSLSIPSPIHNWLRDTLPMIAASYSKPGTLLPLYKVKSKSMKS